MQLPYISDSLPHAANKVNLFSHLQASFSFSKPPLLSDWLAAAASPNVANFRTPDPQRFAQAWKSLRYSRID